LAGPRTISEFIEPTIAKAAADAGRPKPRIIAGVPVLVSDDVDAARTVAAEQLGFYATIPSYQNVLAREGVDNVAEIAAVGPANSVVQQVKRYFDAGATDVVLNPVERTDLAMAEAIWEVAATL
jgi:alkanesulfonate monooxygenase SsuD/methylene tetrahydromethanopterin reductase-like flavin-dependent oxidoreductase (luciferase family)